MIGSCPRYRIKCALVKFALCIFLGRALCTSGIIYIFIFPVLSPAQCCISILILLSSAAKTAIDGVPVAATMEKANTPVRIRADTSFLFTLKSSFVLSIKSQYQLTFNQKFFFDQIPIHKYNISRITTLMPVNHHSLPFCFPEIPQ